MGEGGREGGVEKVFFVSQVAKDNFLFCIFLHYFFQVSEDHDWDGERVVMTDRYFVISLD